MSKIERVDSLESLKTHIETIETDLILIVIDSNVYNLYRKKFDFLNFKGKKTAIWKCLEGEKTKNYEELQHALEFFLSKKAHRNAHLVAFGGGAASDFGGLVASMLLRGVKWSVVPTSLLSMIDAAIGGKVAINSEYGKNLVGAFHLPENIFIYEDFLESLPDVNMLGGKGELLKYFFLSKTIHDLIMNEADFSEIIKHCALFKQQIVEEDFKEDGRRKILNLGHTLGHAIEKIYKLEHGIAVYWGLILIFLVFDDQAHLTQLKLAVDKLKLDFGDSPWLNKTFPADEVLEYIRNDKKALDLNSLDIITMKEIGEPEIRSVTFDDISKKLIEKKDELKKFIL